MSNLGTRLVTAGVVIPLLVLFIFFLPDWMLMIPGGIVIFAGSLEVMAMIGQSRRKIQYAAGSTVILVYCAFVLHMARSDWTEPARWILSSGLVSCTLLLLGIMFYRPIETAGKRLAGMLVALVYPGLLLTILIVIHNTVPDGPWWAFLILATAFLGDTGAYFAGRAFGKHPLAPNLSPKKTVEGVAGGLLGSMLATLCAHFIFLPRITLADAIVLGVLGSAADVIGDLVESLVKRSGGIKDAGSFFPGHGGVMDRIDGLLFVIPPFYAYITFRFM
jgi:phosphatidate cytidylyltransferase